MRHHATTRPRCRLGWYRLFVVVIWIPYLSVLVLATEEQQHVSPRTNREQELLLDNDDPQPPQKIGGERSRRHVFSKSSHPIASPTVTQNNYRNDLQGSDAATKSHTNSESLSSTRQRSSPSRVEDTNKAFFGTTKSSKSSHSSVLFSIQQNRGKKNRRAPTSQRMSAAPAVPTVVSRMESHVEGLPPDLDAFDGSQISPEQKQVVRQAVGYGNYYNQYANAYLNPRRRYSSGKKSKKGKKRGGKGKKDAFRAVAPRAYREWIRCPPAVRGKTVALSDDGQIMVVGLPARIPSAQDPKSHYPRVKSVVRVYESFSWGQWKQLGQDIISPDINGGFGADVDITGSYPFPSIVVGCPKCNGGRGGFFTYFLNNSTKWVQYGGVFSDFGVFSRAGTSVNIGLEGYQVLVGAPGGEGGIVFNMNSQFLWEPSFFTHNNTNFDHCGKSTSMSEDGNVLAIGCPARNNNAGGVDTFRFSEDANNFLPIVGEEILQGHFHGDRCGTMVELDESGRRLATGCPGVTVVGVGAHAGVVRIFDLAVSQDEAQWEKRIPDITGKRRGTKLGSSLALSGTGFTVAVGQVSKNQVTRVATYSIVENHYYVIGPGVPVSKLPCRQLELSLSRSGGKLAVGARNHIKVYKRKNFKTEAPSAAPSTAPSVSPAPSTSSQPSVAPTRSPAPSVSPSDAPSTAPSVPPSEFPSLTPSVSPTRVPSATPSEPPSRLPSSSPTNVPTPIRTDPPSQIPSVSPSDAPSRAPSVSPSRFPSASPSERPSDSPSEMPSSAPSSTPSSATDSPSTAPSLSSAPSSNPTDAPSNSPTDPDNSPTDTPSSSPSTSAAPSLSSAPSSQPSSAPSNSPTDSDNTPTDTPSSSPSTSAAPSLSSAPSSQPSTSSAPSDSSAPSNSPSETAPTDTPSSSPSTSSAPSLSSAPSSQPSSSSAPSDSSAPSNSPSETAPTENPSSSPSTSTAPSLSSAPSSAPSGSAAPSVSSAPSDNPSVSPSLSPSDAPSNSPSSSTAPSLSSAPSSAPSGSTAPSVSSAPSDNPSVSPSSAPSDNPSNSPSSSVAPSLSSAPSSQPSSSSAPSVSSAPSDSPSTNPSSSPSDNPSNSPSVSVAPSLSSAPSSNPSLSNAPSVSSAPSDNPSESPSDAPSDAPSNEPSIASVPGPATIATVVQGISVTLDIDNELDDNAQAIFAAEFAATYTAFFTGDQQDTNNGRILAEAAVLNFVTNIENLEQELVPGKNGGLKLEFDQFLFVTQTGGSNLGPQALVTIPLEDETVSDNLVNRLQNSGNPAFQELTKISEPVLPPTDAPSNSPSISSAPSTSANPSTSTAPSTQPSPMPSVSGMPSTTPSLSNAPSTSAQPSSNPSSEPSESSRPSLSPSTMPSEAPSVSFQPSNEPSLSTAPSDNPSVQPSNEPSLSVAPSTMPSMLPSNVPSNEPSVSNAPSTSSEPSDEPSQAPSVSSQPSSNPSLSSAPSNAPSDVPSTEPSLSSIPSTNPSLSNAPSVEQPSKKGRSSRRKNNNDIGQGESDGSE